MKKSLVAAALSAVLTPAAFAQTNVTLYGIADAGVSADRTGGSGVSTTVRVNSGYMSSSRFGVTGTEDLGAGLKGVFTLELGYDIDTGGFKQYRGNPGNIQPSPQNQTAIAATDARGTNIFGGFNRRSFVGLQGGFGTIALGRDYTPFFWAQLATDTLGYGLYGNLLNLTSVTGTGSELFSRVSNALFYTSPKFAGLTIRGAFSAGGESFGASTPAGTPVALPRRANQLFGVGAEYGLGPLVVTAAVQEVRLANFALTPATTPGVAPTTATFTGGTSDRRDWTVGAKLNLGVFGLAGGYARVDPQGRARAQQAWLGATVGIGRGSLLFQVNRIEQEFAATTAEGTADTASLSFTYPFSRRTTAYATYGYVRNNSNSAVGLFASDNSVAAASAGSDPRGFALGVRHSF